MGGDLELMGEILASGMWERKGEVVGEERT